MIVSGAACLGIFLLKGETIPLGKFKCMEREPKLPNRCYVPCAIFPFMGFATRGNNSVGETLDECSC